MTEDSAGFEVVPRQARGDNDEMGRFLRSWRARSVAGGWSFPSDWAVAGVREVAAAVLHGTDPTTALTGLGGARARVGVGLRETLRDLAALQAAVAYRQRREEESDRVPNTWLRAVAVGWSDETERCLVSTHADDPLTGLATAAYLRTRLLEVYQECEYLGVPVADRYAVVVVSLGHEALPPMSRAAGMITVAAALHLVFCAGETRALLAPSTAVVLTPVGHRLADRVSTARRLVARRLAADPATTGVTQAVWIAQLPAVYDAARGLTATVLRH
ncbi:GGDEF domain-containing protein [Solihabitans fulvus]|uniref:GGDEF domain-containing protein n=1 Tax=Solihabitans fulvus TaxID=1892852 RepID=A0A5B2WWM0_9PSEU|nr:GGDEF domain-containing protein [Solihabitans fulvus]KAA2255344.1 GGDEF domain-containing protein [Solihabitans fulvus]